MKFIYELTRLLIKLPLFFCRCAHLPSRPLLEWSAAVQESVARFVSSPAVVDRGGVFDAVHLRGGDKLVSRDVLVGVPPLDKEDIRNRVLGHLRAARRHHGGGAEEKSSPFKPLLFIATDTPGLVDEAGFHDAGYEVIQVNHRGELTTQTSVTSGGLEHNLSSKNEHSKDRFAETRPWVESSFTQKAALEEPARTDTGPSHQCATLKGLAIEMAIMEKSRHLIISEHSNIGRRVTLRRAQASTVKDGNGDGDGGAHESVLVRYLYSMEVRRLLSASVQPGEWEMAVKRNDEDAVAVLVGGATRAAICSMTSLDKVEQHENRTDAGTGLACSAETELAASLPIQFQEAFGLVKADTITRFPRLQESPAVVPLRAPHEQKHFSGRRPSHRRKSTERGRT